MTTNYNDYYADSAVPLTGTNRRLGPTSDRRPPQFDEDWERPSRRSPRSEPDDTGAMGDLLSRSQAVFRTVLSKTGLDAHIASKKIEELQARMQAPVRNGTVAVFARKGGVGKTTVAAYLGMTLREHRGGRIAAVDGDSDSGSLGWMLAPEVRPMLNALSNAKPMPRNASELRRYMERTPEGLDVVAVEPSEYATINTPGLRQALRSIRDEYDFAMLDVGPSAACPQGEVMLDTAAVGVLVIGPSIDGVRAAERALSWLDRRERMQGHHLPVIAVLNGVSDEVDAKELMRIEKLFAAKCDAFVEIPWDLHLSSGSPIVDLDELSKRTQIAFLELAAAVIAQASHSRHSSLRGSDRYARN